MSDFQKSTSCNHNFKSPTALFAHTNSNLLTVTDAKSQQTVYTYNNMNRTATRKDPLLKTEAYTYDNNGNVATVTDRKSKVTTYTYDLLNRKTKATYQDGTSTNYTYDAGNRLTQIQEKDAGNTVTATITRTYDDLDRLTQEVTAQGTLTYTYDNASRRVTMTVAGQPTVNYTYDNANRLTQITQGANLVTIGYDDADRRASLTLPNGNSVVYAYNAASELLSLTYKQGATVIGDLTYTYDAAGNRIKQGGSFARGTIPPALATASYNVNNQQTTFGTNTLTYDFNGNLQTVTDAGGMATYSWNARNQLTGISATGFAASFAYDSFGRRTGKSIQGTTTNFVYDGLNPVQEKAGATVTANLLTGLGIDEFLTRTDGAGTRGLLTDALGSTVALGDGTGTLETQYTYEPFGYVSQAGLANTNSYKYSGREDDGSRLYYYRARYYHPRLQHFIAEDPIGFGGEGVNLYEYVDNSPNNLSDSLGLFESDPLLRTTIPGQVSWDNSVSDFQSGNYLSSGIHATAILGEQALFVLFVGQAKVAQQCLASLPAGLGQFTDWARWGPTIVSRQLIDGSGATGAVITWGLKGGGTNSATGFSLPFHYHIHRYNWYRPWTWFRSTPILK